MLLKTSTQHLRLDALLHPTSYTPHPNIAQISQDPYPIASEKGIGNIGIFQLRHFFYKSYLKITSGNKYIDLIIPRMFMVIGFHSSSQPRAILCLKTLELLNQL